MSRIRALGWPSGSEDYHNVSVRKIENGYLRTESTPDRYAETFHETKPVVEAGGNAPPKGKNSLSGAVKAMPKD